MGKPKPASQPAQQSLTRAPPGRHPAATQTCGPPGRSLRRHGAGRPAHGPGLLSALAPKAPGHPAARHLADLLVPDHLAARLPPDLLVASDTQRVAWFWDACLLRWLPTVCCSGMPCASAARHGTAAAAARGAHFTYTAPQDRASAHATRTRQPGSIQPTQQGKIKRPHELVPPAAAAARSPGLRCTPL